jgi:hypothetical protein
VNRETEGLEISDQDQPYLDLLLKAIRICAEYRPKFGQGSQAGLTLDQFTQLYGADPFYSWFGFDSPLVYAAHRAAGGMTSVYRQVGIGCQWVFNRILRDMLGLSETEAHWSYSIPGAGVKDRALSLDARIPLDAVSQSRRDTVAEWLRGAAFTLGLELDSIDALRGAVFEVRQGYKSKDAKRQNADIANAANAYAAQYLPVVALLSTQIDNDVALRYRRARWLLLTGTINGSAFDSTYLFFRDIIGYDLAGFFARNAPILRREITFILEKLLGEA